MDKPDSDLDKVLAAVAASGVAGLAVGIARGLISNRHGGLAGFLRGAVASVITSVLVGLAIADSGLSPTKQYAIVGLCAYVADDLLTGVIVLFQAFATNPMKFLMDVWTSIRGGRVQAPPPPPSDNDGGKQ